MASPAGVEHLDFVLLGAAAAVEVMGVVVVVMVVVAVVVVKIVVERDCVAVTVAGAEVAAADGEDDEAC